MGKITETLPKPLIPVAGIPAVVHVIEGIRSAGITEFILVTGYLEDQVRSTLGTGESLGVRITYIHQDKQLGTGHAVGLTRPLAAGFPVLLAYADIMTSPANYERLINHFSQERCDIAAAVRRVDDPWRAAAVYVDAENNIQRIIEKPPIGTSTTPWAHAGMYCFSSEIYDYVQQLQPSSRGEYEITDAVSSMIRDKHKCHAVEMTGYWKDLATMEDVHEAEAMMLNPG